MTDSGWVARYDIVAAETPADLAAEVGQKLGKAWQPYGPMQVIPADGDIEATGFCQPIVMLNDPYVTDRMLGYVVLMDDHPESLAEVVEDRMSCGWVPLGAVGITGEGTMYQAMVRRGVDGG